MGRKRSRGLGPSSALETFVPLAVGAGMAGAYIGISAAGATAARAAGQPGAGALMDVATMAGPITMIGVAYGKKRRL